MPRSTIVRDRLKAAQTWQQRARVAPLVLWAAIVWIVQFQIVVPITCVGAVASTRMGRAVNVALIVSGFGFIYSLYYLGVNDVPRAALQPWGL